MSSRMRKKKNQRHQLSKKSTAHLLKFIHVNGCMYGVHSFEYKDHGNDYWTKTCIANNNGIVCGATYQVHGAELEWVKGQQNVTGKGYSVDS
jgi:hypothetical protein